MAPTVGEVGGRRRLRAQRGLAGRGGARAASLGGERRLRADDRGGRARERGPGVGARRPRGSAAGARTGAGHPAAGRRRRAGILAVATPLRRRPGQRGTVGRGRRRSSLRTRSWPQERKRRSSIARLARVRGRLEAAAGRMDAADAAFRHGIDQLHGAAAAVRAGVDSSWPTGRCCGGAVTVGRRRSSWRPRVSASRHSGHARSSSAAPRELEGSGLAPTKRTDVDPARLTPQELAVARLAATGMSNRDIASEMAHQRQDGPVPRQQRLREAGRALPAAARQPSCGLGWGLSAASTSTVS